MPTPAILGPGPGLIVHSSAGFLFRVADPAPVNGTGSYGWVPTVHNPPGGTVIVSGTGDHPVTLSGAQGTLIASFRAGAPGAPHAVAILVDSSSTPVGMVGILMDGSNRPYCLLTDAAGTVVARSETFGPAFALGDALHVHLTWDAQHAFNGQNHVLISINEQVPNVWDTEAIIPWATFTPTRLLVGYGVGADFNGQVGFVQATNQTFEVLPTGSGLPQLESVWFLAVSSVTPDLLAKYVLASSLTAGASVTADLTWVGGI